MLPEHCGNGLSRHRAPGDGRYRGSACTSARSPGTAAGDCLQTVPTKTCAMRPATFRTKPTKASLRRFCRPPDCRAGWCQQSAILDAGSDITRQAKTDSPSGRRVGALRTLSARRAKGCGNGSLPGAKRHDGRDDEDRQQYALGDLERGLHPGRCECVEARHFEKCLCDANKNQEILPKAAGQRCLPYASHACAHPPCGQ